MKLTWLELTIYGLACLRLAILLSEDTGPVRMFQKLRSFLKREAKQHPALRKSDVHKGIECLRCSSIWVSGPIAAYAYYHDALADWFTATGDTFLLCFALSGIAIILNRAFPAR